MPESQRMSCKIFNYTTNEFEIIRFDTSEKCEEVCRRLCIEHDFTPVVETLFGLRYAQKNQNSKHIWLPGCHTLEPNTEYEFRLRFKIDPVSKLSDLDKEAYNYYYFQVRHDLLAQDIEGLDYSVFANIILGLCMTDMYRELIERKSTEKELKKNFDKYIPRDIKRHHRIFIKGKICKFLDNIKHKSHCPFFIREAYLKDIHKIAPNYLTETFVAKSNYLPEHGYTDRGIITIDIEVTPHHKEQPGIRIKYPCKEEKWEHHRMEDIISIMVVNNDSILLDVKNCRHPRKFTIKDRTEMETFITCVAGYYRLMVKWTYNICNVFPSPLLNKLLEIKCHGPVGGAFSYKKLERNGFKTGSYIIRQCEENFGQFLIDIVIKSEPETFKIVQKGTKFIFHKRDGTTETFSELDQLAKSIELPRGSTHLRFSPVSEKDRPVKLLLCATPETLQAIEKVNDFSVMENKAPRIIGKQSLLLHKQTLREVDYGRMAEYQADLLLPSNKKIDCKVKYLKLTLEREYLAGFMDLADFWANIDSQDILRLYGVTLQSNNRCLVLESYQTDLKRFLREKKSRGQRVPTLNLIDAAQCLAKAVNYMQDFEIVHGLIRCSNVFIKSYEENSSLVVKLGDPGLPRPYDISDMPWIPLEHFSNLEKAKNDVKTDIWAFATTIWEIFSHGFDINIANPVQFFANGQRLKPPEECIERKEIYEIMREGWDEDPDKRFSSQFVLSRLAMARNMIDSPYSYVSTDRAHKNSECTNYTATNASVMTETTDISDNFTIMSNGNGYSHSSLNSVNSSINSAIHSGDNEILQPFALHEAEEFQREFVNRIITLDDATITFVRLLGAGNFGQVYEGTFSKTRTNIMTSVALKVLSTSGKGKLDEALQEAKLMHTLDHPNIVKILLYKEFSSQLVIVMELMKNQSLDIYLKSNRPKIKSIRLMKFAKDVASGMQYLQGKKIVHRDLAARNVLVESDNCVKISDFGLARFADGDYYSVKTTDRAMPILWHAPESIRHNKFSSLSDVWSFGIVLFEMFSCGDKPYQELNSRFTGQDRSTELPCALDKYLEDGYRMDRPDNCPETVFEQLIEPCWEYDPHTRPTFSDLLGVIVKIIETHKDEVEFNTCYT